MAAKDPFILYYVQYEWGKTFSLNAYNCDLQVKYCLKKMIINEIYHFLCHVGDKSCILTFKVAAICLKCIVYNANGRKTKSQE